MYPFRVVLQRNIAFMAVILLIASMLKYIRQLLLIPTVWFVGSLLVMFICTGGVVYSVLHNVPWFKFERDEFGKTYVAEYFMRGQRGQWAGEGYIVSFLTVLTGLLFVFLTQIHKYVQGTQKIRIVFCTVCFVIYSLTQMILACYKIKSPWYGPTFFPPGHYQMGPLMNDQGSNI